MATDLYRGESRISLGGGENPQAGAPTYNFYQVFQKNCMKLRKFWSVGGGAHAGSAPLRSATAINFWNLLSYLLQVPRGLGYENTVC